MKRTLLPVILVAAVACGKKEAPVESTAAAPSRSGPDIPADPASKKFADKLLDLEIEDWSPTDSGEVDFVYQHMYFNEDNTWHATARVTVIDEYVNCKESGTWTMDPAESATVGSVNWVVKNTTCPGRETGTETRVEMAMGSGGAYKIKFR